MSQSHKSSPPPTPQSSALPPPPYAGHEHDASASQEKRSQDSSLSKVKPARKPLLRLELRDLSSEGSRAFLRLVHASNALEDAVDVVLKHLYAGLDTSCIPPTRSVTLVLRHMDGVAYTTGRDIDDDHKEIHLSTEYISKVPENRQKEEILGVLVHEMVHCWQYNGSGTAPGGLIEGIADWVRLNAGYAPPHWKNELDKDGEWDAGYERTGYFLAWLEKDHGKDIVRRINQSLRKGEYHEEDFWKSCCGKSITELWEQYQHRFEGASS